MYRAYYNHSSHFYTHYDRTAKAVHVRRSRNLAKRHANWFRSHGDWRNVVANNGLVHQVPSGYRSPLNRTTPRVHSYVGVPKLTNSHRSVPTNAGLKRHLNQVAQHRNATPRATRTFIRIPV